MLKYIVLAASIALLSTANSIPAAAQSASRTYVSASAGTDNSLCGLSNPCRTLAAGVAAIRSGGIVYCLSTGAYGTVNITKSVLIACDKVDADISGKNGVAAVTIAAGPNDGVTLQGLHITGGNSGETGINYVSGAAVLVDQCIVTATGTAVNVTGPKITIQDSSLIGNQIGISINSASNPVGMSVDNSLISGNQGAAISIAGGSSGAAVSFDKDKVTANGAAVSATGATQVSFDSSLVSGNTAFFVLSGNSGVFSYGNNQFSNNGGTLGPNTSGYQSFGPQ